MCSQKHSDGALLLEEQASLDCLITKNQPEMGLQRLIELSTIFYGSTPKYLAKPRLSSQIFGETILVSSSRCGRDILFLNTMPLIDSLIGLIHWCNQGQLAISLDKGWQHFFLLKAGADRLLFGAGCSHSDESDQDTNTHFSSLPSTRGTEAA